MAEEGVVIDAGATVTDGGKAGKETPATPEQVSQISDMLSFFDGTSSEGGEKTPKKEPEKEKPDKEPEGDIAVEKPPVEDGTKGPPESPQDTRIAELEEQIKQLMEKLNNPEAEKETKEKAATDEESYFKQQLELAQKDLVSEYVAEDEYEAVFEKREKLNEILKKVQTDTLQGVFRSIPRIIATMIPQHITWYNKTTEFYASNPDLLEHRSKVGAMIDEIAAKNPSWSIDQLMEFVGGKKGEEADIGELRKRLGLKKQAIKAAEKENIRRPSFAKPAHTRQPGKPEPKLEGVQKEISDMIESID